MKRKQLAISFISILLITLLAACGDSDSSSETENGNDQEESSTAQENNGGDSAADKEEEAAVTEEQASQTSETFITHLDDGDFDEAESLFDETMASEITAADLETIWTDLETEFGEFTGFDYVEDQQVDEYHTFIYEGTFDDQPFVLNVSINGNNEVGGFYIQPSEA